MTRSYNLEQVVIIKSGFVLNCMISDKRLLFQAHITQTFTDFLYFCTCTIWHDYLLQTLIVVQVKPVRLWAISVPASIGIMNVCMCLGNKYYGVTQSRSSVRPNCGKVEINTQA